MTFVGTLPPGVQPGDLFAGAVTKNAREPEAATAQLRFLTAPDKEPVIKKAGLTPLSERVDDRISPKIGPKRSGWPNPDVLSVRSTAM